VALLLSPLPAAEAELRQLRTHLERLKTPVGIWLVFPEREMFNTRTPAEELLAAARQHLADYAPGVPFGGGTNADFIFFNRFPIDPTNFDALAITTNPTVHAIDNASVVETLTAQGTLVQSAHRLAGGKPLLITPVTLKMRHNPYATAAPPPVLADELPPQVDVRQMSLFGAGWTLGSIKYLAENGVSSATYYETTGWRGVMETAYGSNVPEKFRAFPGGVFPLYHIFADVGEFAAGEIVLSKSSQPLGVNGLILRQADRSRVLLANLTDSPQQVELTGLPAQVQVRLLDETNAEAAMQAPEEWRRVRGEGRSTADGVLTLDLRPYAIARIDG
jgi:D-apionolactonase